MTEATHAIRLTAAWERSEGGHWLRSFGRPSGLEQEHRVLLVVVGAAEEPRLLLNGKLLGATDEADRRRCAWDVTGMLTHRNTLEWVRDGRDGEPPASGRCPLPRTCGEVALEIFTTRSVNNA